MENRFLAKFNHTVGREHEEGMGTGIGKGTGVGDWEMRREGGT